MLFPISLKTTLLQLILFASYQTGATVISPPEHDDALSTSLTLGPRQTALQECSIAGTSARVNCRGGPARSYPGVTSFWPGDSFGVECMVDGEGIDGEKAWGYLPAYDCWISVRYTDLGCKRKLPTC